MRSSTESKNPQRVRVVRILKIQPKIRINRWSVSKAPEIRLCGNWLERLGFLENHRVEIIGEHGVLVIKVAEKFKVDS